MTDIKTVVVAKHELELGRKVTDSTRHESKQDRRGATHKSRSRSDRHEARNRTRAESDSRPLALKAPIPEHPGQTTDRGSEVGDDARLRGTQIRGKGRAAVESEPTEPEEDRAEDDVGCVVWFVGEALGTISAALAEVDRDGQC